VDPNLGSVCRSGFHTLGWVVEEQRGHSIDEGEAAVFEGQHGRD